jgi:hypothetical protein
MPSDCSKRANRALESPAEAICLFYGPGCGAACDVASARPWKKLVDRCHRCAGPVPNFQYRYFGQTGKRVVRFQQESQLCQRRLH